MTYKPFNVLLPKTDPGPPGHEELALSLAAKETIAPRLRETRQHVTPTGEDGVLYIFDHDGPRPGGQAPYPGP